MFSLLWLRIGKWVALIGGALAALFAIWKTGKASGEAKATVKAAEQKTQANEQLAVREIARAQAENTKTVETVEAANDVNQTVNNLDDNAVREQLLHKWQRKGP